MIKLGNNFIKPNRYTPQVVKNTKVFLLLHRFISRSVRVKRQRYIIRNKQLASAGQVTPFWPLRRSNRFADKYTLHKLKYTKAHIQFSVLRLYFTKLFFEKKDGRGGLASWLIKQQLRSWRTKLYWYLTLGGRNHWRSTFSSRLRISMWRFFLMLLRIYGHARMRFLSRIYVTTLFFDPCTPYFYFYKRNYALLYIKRSSAFSFKRLQCFKQHDRIGSMEYMATRASRPWWRFSSVNRNVWGLLRNTWQMNQFLWKKKFMFKKTLSKRLFRWHLFYKYRFHTFSAFNWSRTSLGNNKFWLLHKRRKLFLLSSLSAKAKTLIFKRRKGVGMLRRFLRKLYFSPTDFKRKLRSSLVEANFLKRDAEIDGYGQRSKITQKVKFFTWMKRPRSYFIGMAMDHKALSTHFQFMHHNRMTLPDYKFLRILSAAENLQLPSFLSYQYGIQRKQRSSEVTPSFDLLSNYSRMFWFKHKDVLRKINFSIIYLAWRVLLNRYSLSLLRIKKGSRLFRIINNSRLQLNNNVDGFVYNKRSVLSPLKKFAITGRKRVVDGDGSRVDNLVTNTTVTTDAQDSIKISRNNESSFTIIKKKQLYSSRKKFKKHAFKIRSGLKYTFFNLFTQKLKKNKCVHDNKLQQWPLKKIRLLRQINRVTGAVSSRVHLLYLKFFLLKLKVDFNKTWFLVALAVYIISIKNAQSRLNTSSSQVVYSNPSSRWLHFQFSTRNLVQLKKRYRLFKKFGVNKKSQEKRSMTLVYSGLKHIGDFFLLLQKFLYRISRIKSFFFHLISKFNHYYWGASLLRLQSSRWKLETASVNTAEDSLFSLASSQRFFFTRLAYHFSGRITLLNAGVNFRIGSTLLHFFTKNAYRGNSLYIKKATIAPFKGLHKIKYYNITSKQLLLLCATLQIKDVLLHLRKFFMKYFVSMRKRYDWLLPLRGNSSKGYRQIFYTAGSRYRFRCATWCLFRQTLNIVFAFFSVSIKKYLLFFLKGKRLFNRKKNCVDKLSLLSQKKRLRAFFFYFRNLYFSENRINSFSNHTNILLKSPSLSFKKYKYWQDCIISKKMTFQYNYYGPFYQNFNPPQFHMGLFRSTNFWQQRQRGIRKQFYAAFKLSGYRLLKNKVLVNTSLFESVHSLRRVSGNVGIASLQKSDFSLMQTLLIKLFISKGHVLAGVGRYTNNSYNLFKWSLRNNWKSYFFSESSSFSFIHVFSYFGMFLASLKPFFLYVNVYNNTVNLIKTLSGSSFSMLVKKNWKTWHRNLFFYTHSEFQPWNPGIANSKTLRWHLTRFYSTSDKISVYAKLFCIKKKFFLSYYTHKKDLRLFRKNFFSIVTRFRSYRRLDYYVKLRFNSNKNFRKVFKMQILRASRTREDRFLGKLKRKNCRFLLWYFRPATTLSPLHNNPYNALLKRLFTDVTTAVHAPFTLLSADFIIQSYFWNNLFIHVTANRVFSSIASRYNGLSFAVFQYFFFTPVKYSLNFSLNKVTPFTLKSQRSVVRWPSLSVDSRVLRDGGWVKRKAGHKRPRKFHVNTGKFLPALRSHIFDMKKQGFTVDITSYILNFFRFARQRSFLARKIVSFIEQFIDLSLSFADMAFIEQLQFIKKLKHLLFFRDVTPFKFSFINAKTEFYRNMKTTMWSFYSSFKTALFSNRDVYFYAKRRLFHYYSSFLNSSFFAESPLSTRGYYHSDAVVLMFYKKIFRSAYKYVRRLPNKIPFYQHLYDPIFVHRKLKNKNRFFLFTMFKSKRWGFMLDNKTSKVFITESKLKRSGRRTVRYRKSTIIRRLQVNKTGSRRRRHLFRLRKHAARFLNMHLKHIMRVFQTTAHKKETEQAALSFYNNAAFLVYRLGLMGTLSASIMAIQRNWFCIDFLPVAQYSVLVSYGSVLTLFPSIFVLSAFIWYRNFFIRRFFRSAVGNKHFFLSKRPFFVFASRKKYRIQFMYNKYELIKPFILRALKMF